MSSVDEFLSDLNPAQREAVEAVEGPLLIIAGAGSGKTRAITYRIAYMMGFCGIQPWNILAVTFTNKAAGEMRRRVVELIGGTDPGPSLQVSTFHSACARLLRREAYKLGLSSSFTICDESDQSAIVKDCMRTLELEPDDIHPNMVLNLIGQAKMRLLGPEDYAQSAESKHEKLAADIFTLYQKRLRENDAVDFDDLLGYVVKLFDDSPETLQEYQQRFRYVLVDEYQDTNFVQYRLVEALAREHRNLCVVGDEDQSIYSWRGAEIANLLDFQKHFPEAKVIRLEQNYRSTQAILEAANAVIGNNSERLGKTLWTAREGGAKPVVMVADSGHDEAQRVVERALWHNANGARFRDMAVFYRANALSRPFEDQLRLCKVPYRVVGGLRFYDRMEVKDLLAYLHVIENPGNSIHLLRVINRPKRGLGEKAVATLQQTADRLGVSCYKAIEAGAKEGLLTGAAAAKMKAFREMVEAWRGQRKARATIRDLLASVLKDTGYVESLGDPKDFEVVARRENIDELATAIAEYEESNPASELGDFLEMISLRSPVDDMGEEDALSLMTLHCAKGLEFKVVFIVAVEEPIFPNAQAIDARGNFEEERRLFYVGVTRAQEHLYLSRAESRFRFGQTMYNKVSKFLLEIPPELVERDAAAMPPLGGVGRGREDWFADTSRPRFGERRKIERGSVFDRAKARGPRSAFAQGQRVRHAVLGEGTVDDIMSAAGGRTLLVIRFDDGEKRALDERRSNLKVI